MAALPLLAVVPKCVWRQLCRAVVPLTGVAETCAEKALCTAGVVLAEATT